MDRRLKIALITLLIILLSLISFVGLFVQDTKFMKNKVPEYILGMDLDGYRAITLKVSDEKETVYYDKDGNVVEEEADDRKTEEVPVNSEDLLTKENYLKTKKIVEKRLNDLGVMEYLIRLDEKNGALTAQIPEDSLTNLASQFLYSRGEFTVEDEDGQVLLDNSNLDKVEASYRNVNTGIEVYLRIHVNKDSKEKLRNLSTTYVESQDEEGNDTSKEVVVNIDGAKLTQTVFDNEITNGIWDLTLTTGTDSNTLNQYLVQANNIAILLNSGKLPVVYTVEQNRYITSDITLDDFLIPLCIVGGVLVIGFLVLIIKYKKLGLFAIISFIGYMALLLLAARYFNLVITLEAIAAIIGSAILNYIILVYLMSVLKKSDKTAVEYKNVLNKSYISALMILLPTIIIGIVLCFATWLPAYSFGTMIFWGVLIMALYNASITRLLFIYSVKEKK